jgi:hypothetical protein
VAFVEHGLGEAGRHLGDGRGGIGDRASFADVLSAGGRGHPGGGLAGAEIRLARALVREPAAAGHGHVASRRAGIQARGDGQQGQAGGGACLIDQREDPSGGAGGRMTSGREDADTVGDGRTAC